MSDDRSDSVSRLASRERDKNPEKSQSESASDSPSALEETGETADGSQSATNVDAASHPSGDTSESTPAENASEARSVNIKDRGSSLFMYLPQSLGNEIDLACQSVNLTYQQESGEKLGKNHYLYPIVLMVGVDAAFDLSAEEISDLVERVDEIEDGR
jgi:hypothetical protein